MWWPFRKTKTLDQVLFETKKIKVHGVVFRVRKINPVDYLRGARAHVSFFQTYEQASAEEKLKLQTDEKSLENMQHHLSDVFMSCVVEPKLCYAKDKEEKPDHICVDNFFTDWTLANDLYLAIVEYTFGKKKPTSRH